MIPPPPNELLGGGGAGLLKGFVRLGGGLGFAISEALCGPSIALPRISADLKTQMIVNLGSTTTQAHFFSNPPSRVAGALARLG